MLSDVTVKVLWMIAESGLLIVGIVYLRKLIRTLQRIAAALERR